MASDLFDILDPRFSRLVHANTQLDRLHTGCRWAEGPVYVPAGKYVLWSDIPNDRVMRFDETDGSVSVFQHSAFHANGHTLDPFGRVIACEHGTRSVTRFEHDGSCTILASQWDGRQLNSPNDVVVRSDGSVWFTDPTYGIDSDYEGHASESEIGASHVFRIDPQSGLVEAVAQDFDKPNGLAFSPDEQTLYVSDTGYDANGEKLRHIRRFQVNEDGRSLSGGEVFAVCRKGVFDGFRFDLKGHLWTSAGDGVHCYHPDGTLMGVIHVPEVVANLCFGGPKRNRLYICATTSLYAIYVNARGAGVL